MSGHSKWSQIKRKKGKEDAKRGNLFTKLIREIAVIAKDGGGDPDTNPRLRTAIESAKSASMPKENIERAIKRGTGELPGVSYEPVSYEGYGPGGVALFIEALTDNKNRTTSAMRHIFSQCGGNLGSSGCVAWMFVEKGTIYVAKNETTEETLLEVCIEEGGEDVVLEGDSFRITTSPDKFENVKKALEERKIKYRDAEFTKIPKSTVKLEGKNAVQTLKLMDSIEEQEDVQKVYANFDIPDEIFEKLEA
ncbi:YebC/PmpR family DNA-binding transcriptional regulator [candidate division WOR-3 bacterium]|nr:YebC/PmpR family DNA-binding transcriptional regulator [candidate division WOR-3 bacterium]